MMSTVQQPPDRPVDDFESVRDEWIGAVTNLMEDAERWSRARDWDVRRQTKPIYESEIGSYELPRLLIHNGVGRVLLDPIARYVSGLEGGAVDLLSVPDYDGWLLAREGDHWSFYHGDENVEGNPLTESVFETAVNAMAKP